MSIEAMWSMQFINSDLITVTPNTVNSTIFFEGNRVFGGNSLMNYIGEYEITDGLITGTIEAEANTPAVVTLIGSNSRFTAEFIGILHEETMRMVFKLIDPPSDKPVVVEFSRGGPLHQN